jgi:hypothetical protein
MKGSRATYAPIWVAERVDQRINASSPGDICESSYCPRANPRDWIFASKTAKLLCGASFAETSERSRSCGSHVRIWGRQERKQPWGSLSSPEFAQVLRRKSGLLLIVKSFEKSGDRALFARETDSARSKVNVFVLRAHVRNCLLESRNAAPPKPGQCRCSRRGRG